MMTAISLRANSGETVPDAVMEADARDPLRSFRDLFALPKGIIYLDGNSLGALPARTPQRIATTVEREWGAELITSWNSRDWIRAPQRIGAKIARIIGAGTDEVIVSDSTSVNLFKLLVASVRHQQGRSVILTEPGNFPTDLYIAQGVAEILPECRVQTCDVDSLPAAINESTAVVMLTHVHYKSGRRLDMAAITAAAHRSGALILWDLSHSAGAVPLDLNGSGVDLAVGCGYKYLNGGPGAPAFLFVARSLQQALRSPMTGWMGHSQPFEFGDDYEPAADIGRFLCGTPPILGMAALEEAVDLLLMADPAAMAAKGGALGDLFVAEVERRCGDELELVTPRSAPDRGCHVSFAHPQAFAICQALIARGIIGDFRAPDVMRFGFAPLYIRFADIYAAAAAIEDVLKTRAWDDPRYNVRAAVT